MAPRSCVNQNNNKRAQCIVVCSGSLKLGLVNNSATSVAPLSCKLVRMVGIAFETTRVASTIFNGCDNTGNK